LRETLHKYFRSNENNDSPIYEDTIAEFIDEGRSEEVKTEQFNTKDVNTKKRKVQESKANYSIALTFTLKDVKDSLTTFESSSSSDIDDW